MASPTTTRTDTHRPSQMDPADYDDVGYLDVGNGLDDPGDQWIEPAHADKDFVPHSQAQWDDGYTRCGHCGQHARYFEIFLHTPTDRLLPVGMTCAGKLGLSTRHELEMRQAAERRKLAKVRGHFLAGNPRARQAVDYATDHYVAVREAYDGDPLAADHGKIDTNNFLYDLAQKFERYGSLSDKQINAAWWAAERDRQHAIRQDQWDQQRAAEDADRKPCPTGRQQVEGEIIKTDWLENDYGSRHVMTVKTDDGWLVWGTVPSRLDAAKGDRVRFTATLERSDRDEYFGFYKRPTKAEIVEAAVANTDGMSADQLGDILQPEPVPARPYYGVVMTGPTSSVLMDRFETEEAADAKAAEHRTGLEKSPSAAALFTVGVQEVTLDAEIGSTIPTQPEE